jgi:hypothetical protein
MGPKRQKCMRQKCPRQQKGNRSEFQTKLQMLRKKGSKC